MKHTIYQLKYRSNNVHEKIFFFSDRRNAQKNVGVEVHRSKMIKYIGTDEFYWSLQNWISDNRRYTVCNFNLQESIDIKIGIYFPINIVKNTVTDI